ncbi:MAG: 2Fe-2S iron-sulfur cluster-binding protein [Solirubrobacteraceae bacterium]
MTPTGLPIPTPLRSSARRLLHSGLLEALAAPHGVEGYLELVRSPRSLGNPLAELIAARRRSAGSSGGRTSQSLLAPTVSSSGDGTGGSVGFVRSGKRARNDGRSLLEQAERAGLQPQFGCRMGICRICTTRKLSGSVRNVLSGEVSDAGDENIQLCVSVPVGDVELAL